VQTTTELENLFSSNEIRYKIVKQKRFYHLPGKIWNLLVDERNGDLIEKMNTSFIPLKDLAQINRGLITGNKEKYFSEIRISKNYKPILAGRDIQRYLNKQPSLYIKFIKPETAGGCWNERMHFAPHKILIRQIGKEPTATFIDEKIAVTGNVFTVMTGNKDLDKFILGVLNSKLIEFYWKIMFSDFKESFPQVTIYSLSMIPIIKYNETTAYNFVKLVEFILFLKKQQENKSNNLITNFFEQLIDGLVFELYFEEEIKRAGRDILKYLTNLTPITDAMSDEQKLHMITRTYNELSNPNHPVRQNLDGMDEIEEVRIVKGLDK